MWSGLHACVCKLAGKWVPCVLVFTLCSSLNVPKLTPVKLEEHEYTKKYSWTQSCSAPIQWFWFYFIFVTIASRTAELLIRVTGVTSKFKRRTQSCLLIPSSLSLSQRDVSRATFADTSSPLIQEVLNSAYRWQAGLPGVIISSPDAVSSQST